MNYYELVWSNCELRLIKLIADAEVTHPGGMLPVRWSSMELVPQGEESDDMEHDKSLHADSRIEVSCFLLFLVIIIITTKK